MLYFLKRITMAKQPTCEEGVILQTPEESQNITRERIQEQLPRGTSVVVTDAVMQSLATMEDDTSLPQNLLEESFMSYLYLLGKGKGLSVVQLINAIKFCNLKRNMTNRKSWSIVFPTKYRQLMDAGKPVDNHVSMFSGTWLVQEIDKEMLIPVHLQYASAFHQAMNVNMKIMHGDAGVDADGERIGVTAMVRHLAAKTVLEITKAPETAKIDITVGQSDEMVAVKEREVSALEKIVENQQKEFRKGGKTIDVQAIHTRISKASIGRPDEGLGNV